MHHSDFVHLHLHTQYSLLDGAIRLEPLFKKACEYKMPSLAITDHGNMFGAVDFYRTAKKYGIKPIIGCEVYVAPTSRFEKSSQEGISDSSYHLILLAKNAAGYKNLVLLVSAGYLEGFYYRPRIDKEILSKHTEGLIVLSSCMKGEIQRLLHKGQKDDAYKAASFYKDIMGERRFYLEIQDQNIPDQKGINRDMLEMAKKLSIPLAATNDCHYMDEKDADAHEILLCIQTGKVVFPQFLVVALLLSQLVSNHQQAVSDGDNGPLPAPACGQPMEVSRKIRTSDAGSRPSSLTENPPQPGRSTPLLARTLVVARTDPDPGSQMLCGGELFYPRV